LPSELLGPGATALRDSIRPAKLSSRPSTLGGALIQGVADDALGALLDAGLQRLDEQLFGTLLLPRQLEALSADLRARLGEGQGLAEALNGQLNPFVDAFDEAGLMDETAAQAISLAEAGDARAIERSREAGRHLLRAVAGVARGVLVARDLAGGLEELAAPRAARSAAPAPPTPPPAPSGRAPATRADGVTGFAYQAPVPVPSSPLRATPHPHQPHVPVFSREAVDALAPAHEALLLAAQRHNAEQWPKLPAATRRRTSFLQATESVWAEREWLHAAQLQRQNPGDAFLVQFRWESIEGPDGSTPARRILRRIDPDSPGRFEDILQLHAAAPITTPHETKFASQLPPAPRPSGALLGAYPSGPQVEVPSFRPSSTLATQLRKTEALIEAARRRGGMLKGRGYTLDGRLVEVLIDPAGVQPTRVSRDGEPAQ
jgi:hypothetical protein